MAWSPPPPPEQLLKRLPASVLSPCDPAALRLSFLDDGVSNRVYLLREGEDGPARFTLRVPYKEPRRSNALIEEFHNHLLAERAGVALPLLYHDVETGVSLTPYVDARPAENADQLLQGQRLENVAVVLRRLHDSPPSFAHDSDPLRWHRRRRVAPDDPGVAKVDVAGVAENLAMVERVVALLEKLPQPKRPVHGDTVLGNVLFDGDRPQLIDWQLSGMGTAENDVATLAVTAELDAAGLQRLIKAYCSADDDRQPAMMWLHIFLAQHHFAVRTLQKVLDGNVTEKRLNLLRERMAYLTMIRSLNEWQEAFTRLARPDVAPRYTRLKP